MRKTIYDVAKEAGVSISTVSRVLNNSGYVGEKTRNKVLAAAQGYTPSAAAQEMNTKRSNTIGLIVAHDPAYFFMNSIYNRVLIGIADVAREYGYNLLLDIREEKDIGIELYYNKKIDGLLLMGVRENNHSMTKMIEEKIPFVLIGDYSQPLDNLCKVDVDDFDVGYRTAEYLLSLGHRKIGLITGSMNYASCLNRKRGYDMAMRKYGAEQRANDISICEVLSEEEIAVASKKMLSQTDRVTAVCAFNDAVAVGVYGAARELGLSIPKDLSVIGVDDSELSKYVAPALSTVWQPSYEKGYEAARILIESLTNPEILRRSILMQGKLVIRESCASPS